MGTVETALLLKYGLPLAVRLIANGVAKDDAIEATTDMVEAINAEEDVAQYLLKADAKATAIIVDGFYDTLTGVAESLKKLLDLLLGGE